MNIKKMIELDLKDKRVLIREDLNVPIKNGEITSEQRILAALPTLRRALDSGAAVIVMSHLGKPEEGKEDPSLSLAPVAKILSDMLGKDVPLVKDWLNGVEVEPGKIVLCENVRFNLGEKADDEALSKKMAALADIFVMDAFATAHRAQASTHGVAKFAKIACAGPLLVSELEALGKALEEPTKPVVAIVGGAKVSTKLKVLHNLLEKVDQLIVGGGIANTIVAALGYNVGKSLYEKDFLSEAKKLLARAQELEIEIPIPEDVVVAKEAAENAVFAVKDIKDVADEEMILDFGPKTLEKLVALLQPAKTIVWNGPIGVFEFANFANGTRAIADAVAESAAFSMVGGGDTIAAIESMKISNKISYISTAGGAFLEFLEGSKLPAVEILKDRSSN